MNRRNLLVLDDHDLVIFRQVLNGFRHSGIVRVCGVEDVQNELRVLFQRRHWRKDRSFARRVSPSFDRNVEVFVRQFGSVHAVHELRLHAPTRIRDVYVVLFVGRIGNAPMQSLFFRPKEKHDRRSSRFALLHFTKKDCTSWWLRSGAANGSWCPLSARSLVRSAEAGRTNRFAEDLVKRQRDRRNYRRHRRGIHEKR